MSDSTPASAGEPVDRPIAGRFLVGDWTADPASDEIARGGETVKLEPRTMLLLVALAKRPNEVVTIDELLDAVWPGLVVTQSSVYQSVAQLRKTLGDSRTTPEYISTIPRKGYRLIAAVRPVQRAVPPAATPPAIAASPAAPAASPSPVADPRSPKRRWLIGTGAGAGIAAAAGGFWWWRRTGAGPGGLVRLAVLPFSDRSEGSLEQAAADGLANDVIHRFERSSRVVVLARNSSFTFRARADDAGVLETIRRQLDADYALVGDFFRARDSIRVAVRLIALVSGKSIWDDVFVKADDRLAELPGTIAAGALKALGLPDAGTPESNPLEAYELYLLGLNALQTQRTMEGISKARDHFQHAIDADPTYARAYAGLANTWLSQAVYGVGIDLRAAAARAQPLIDRALTIDPNLLEGLLAQGKLHLLTTWSDPARSRAFMQKAVDLYPGSAEAQFGLGASLAFDAQPREAIKRYAMALALDPLNATIHFRWGQDATFSGDYEGARVHFARAGTLMPRNPWRFLGPGQADYARGRLDDAVANYRLQLEQDPRRRDAWGELAWLYLDLGMPAEARAAFAKKAALGNGGVAAGIDEAHVALAEGRDAAVGALLTERGLDQPIAGLQEVDRLTIQAIAGRDPARASIDATVAAMRADEIPWVGSYWIFIGAFAWIDLAALYVVAGAADAAAPLLDDAQAMLARLTARGNAFHTIPYLEARIAALRGRNDNALARLDAAVDAGWRRAWYLPFDLTMRPLRRDARIGALVARVRKETDAQRAHVG